MLLFSVTPGYFDPFMEFSDKRVAIPSRRGRNFGEQPATPHRAETLSLSIIPALPVNRYTALRPGAGVPAVAD